MNDESRKVFESGAQRSNSDEGYRYDLICPTGLRRLAARYYFGAIVRGYGEDNWTRGIPMSNLINHIERHLEAFKLTGNTSDDNLAAIAWNIFALMHYEDQCFCHVCRHHRAELDTAYLESQK